MRRCLKGADLGGWQSAGPAGLTVFGLQRDFLLAAGLAPAAGLTFLCFAKEKISKRKASQRPCPFGVPCATRAARGRAQTRYAQTSARPDPYAAALLSTASWQGARVLVRFAHIAHARAPSLPRHCRSRSLANPQASSLIPQSIYFDCHVHQSGRTNLHRHLSHQRPYPAQKSNWLLRRPFPPGGVMGRGGSGGPGLTLPA